MNSALPGLIALAFGYVLSQFYRACLAVLTPKLAHEFGVEPEAFAPASATFFLVFALMQFPVGAMLGRVGPRRTAGAIMAAGCLAGLAAFSQATAPWHVTLAMGLIGIGCSPIYMASLYIYARTMAPERFAFLSSVLLGVGALGNLVSAAPLSWAIENFGWRETVIGLAAVSGLGALAIWTLVRDPPPAQGPAPGLSGFLEVLKIKALWPMIPLFLVSYAVPAGIRGLWAGPYLNEVFGLSGDALGMAILVMAAAMTVGSFAYAPLDRLVGSQKGVVLPGAAITAILCGLLAAMVERSLTASVILLSLIGMMGLSFGVHLGHGRRFLPDHLIGQGVTLMNFFSIGGLGLAQALTGALATQLRPVAPPPVVYGALFWAYAAALSGATLIYAFAPRHPAPKPQEPAS